MSIQISSAIQEATEHFRAGRMTEAEAACQQILQSEPNQPEALHLLGMIASHIGMHDVAVELIGAVLELAPDNAEAHCNLGKALSALGRLEEAIQSYQRAIELKPGYGEAHKGYQILQQAVERDKAVRQSFAACPADKSVFVFCIPFLFLSSSNGILSVIRLAEKLKRIGNVVYFACVLSEYPDAELVFTSEHIAQMDQAIYEEILNAVKNSAHVFNIEFIPNPQDYVRAGAIVLYTERIIDNPLGASKVIRYFGNRDGFLNGGKLVNAGKSDFILAHSRILHPSPDFTLFFAEINPLFHDSSAPAYEERRKSLTYVGKGSLYGDVGVIAGTQMLLRHAPETKEELADWLRHSRFLFLWDSWTNLMVEALFCGAIPVVLRYAPFTAEEIDASELGPIPRMEFDDLRWDESTGLYDLKDGRVLDEFERERDAFIQRVAQYDADYEASVGELSEALHEHFLESGAAIATCIGT